MPLHELSAELLHAICEVCSNDTLQDLRLTCRRLREVADKHFLLEVVTCIEHGDLANVRRIVDCDVSIRNAVKRFTIQADRFNTDVEDDPLFQRDWFDKQNFFLRTLGPHLSKMEEQSQGRRSTRHRARRSEALLYFVSQSVARKKDKELRKRNYRMYRRMCDDQEALFQPLNGTPSGPAQLSTASAKPSTIRATFDKLFKACPNISALTINHKHTLRMNAGLSNLTYLKGLTIPHGGNATIVERTVGELLPAVFNANLKIRDLAIAGATPHVMSVGAPRTASRHRTADGSAKYHQVLHHVERLQLIFNGSDAQPEDYELGARNGFNFIIDEFADGVLISWLEHCRVVREVRLVLPIAPYVKWRVEMKHIMGELHLEKLAVLKVSNFQAKSEDVIQCLLRHQDTLQEFELDTVHLLDGDWPCCISAFAGKLPHLRRARVGGLLTSELKDENDRGMTTCFLTISQAKELQDEIEEYILDGEGPMPTWPAEGLYDGSSTEEDEDEVGSERLAGSSDDDEESDDLNDESNDGDDLDTEDNWMDEEESMDEDSVHSLDSDTINDSA